MDFFKMSIKLPTEAFNRTIFYRMKFLCENNLVIINVLNKKSYIRDNCYCLTSKA